MKVNSGQPIRCLQDNMIYFVETCENNYVIAKSINWGPPDPLQTAEERREEEKYDPDQKLKKIPHGKYKCVNLLSGDFFDLVDWNMDGFRKLYEKYPFNLNTVENPIATSNGPITEAEDENMNFLHQCLRGYLTFESDTLENAIWLIDNGANLSKITWEYLMSELEKIYVRKPNDYYIRKSKRLMSNKEKLPELIIKCITKFPDVAIPTYVVNDEYPLFVMINKTQNRYLLRELFATYLKTGEKKLSKYFTIRPDGYIVFHRLYYPSSNLVKGNEEGKENVEEDKKENKEENKEDKEDKENVEKN